MSGNRDSLFRQIQELREEQQGISPQLQLYKDLEKKIDALKEKAGGQSMAPRKPSKRPAVLYPKTAKYN